MPFAMMNHYLTLLVALLAAVSCGKKPETTPAPTAITLSQSTLSAGLQGETLALTITSPSRPRFEGMPSWASVKGENYQDYKMTLSIVFAANDSYGTRSADVTVSAVGAKAVTLTLSQEGKPWVTDPISGKEDALTMATKLGMGWNLGNQLDAYSAKNGGGYNKPDETCWGNKRATQATFDKLKSYGFTSVRIPVTWMGAIGAAPEYRIDASWMSRVTEVVSYAHNAGLNVIINTHHDENHGDDHWLDLKNAANDAALNNAIKAEITAVWTQIANQFKDCGGWLIMEGFNELNDGGWGWSAEFRANPTKQCNVLNEWQQTFVNAVRATGGNNASRWLGISTYAANPEFEKYLVLPSDPADKLLLSVHFYDPSDYTIGDAQYSDWGHTGAVGKKANGGDEDHVKSVFGNLYTKYVARNIPVYVGEFGCSMRNKNDARPWAFYLYYLEYVVKAAKEYGLSCFLWDNGAAGYGKERHGYIDHATGDYTGNAKPVIDVMMKARFTEDASYTLQSIYDSAPRF